MNVYVAVLPPASGVLTVSEIISPPSIWHFIVYDPQSNPTLETVAVTICCVLQLETGLVMPVTCKSETFSLFILISSIYNVLVIYGVEAVVP